MDTIMNNVNLASLIEEKINGMDVIQLEDMVMSVMRKRAEYHSKFRSAHRIYNRYAQYFYISTRKCIFSYKTIKIC